MNVGSQSIKLHAKNGLKYLGVTVDANMPWGIHINEITNTLRPLLYYYTHLNILEVY